jgi:hypothetical protein
VDWAGAFISHFKLKIKGATEKFKKQQGFFSCMLYSTMPLLCQTQTAARIFLLHTSSLLYN